MLRPIPLLRGDERGLEVVQQTLDMMNINYINYVDHNHLLG